MHHQAQHSFSNAFHNEENIMNGPKFTILRDCYMVGKKKTSTIFGRIPLVFQDTISFEKKKRSKAGRHLRRCLVHLLVKTLFLLLYFCVKMECLLNMSHTQPNAKRNGSDKKFSKLRMPAIISWAQSLLWSLHNMINDHLVKTKHDSINNIYIY